MRITAFCLAVAVAGAAFAAGQEAPGAPAPGQRVFRLDLQALYLPGYEPARELRLAAWDSPMSRLELAGLREQWALRRAGPTGSVVPFQAGRLPLTLHLDPSVRSLVLGPWNSEWDRLTWQEKVAAGAQTSFFLFVLTEIARHAH